MKIAAWIVPAILAASVASAGTAAAVPAGQACGGDTGAVCDRGLWCEPPTGECTATAGICVAVPRFCIARKRTSSFKPVCGCNSKTYSNDCFRRAYKIAKEHDGTCEAQSAKRSGG